MNVSTKEFRERFELRLVAANEHLLAAAGDGPDGLAAELGVTVPSGWPEFPEAIPVTREFLKLFPEQAAWSMYFFIHDPAQALVGSGGFKGAPLDGMVEIGYEIAPVWRGQGAATSAVAAMLDLARESGDVSRVTAQTLPEINESGAVLEKVGFVRVGGDTDRDVGETWRWELGWSGTTPGVQGP